MQERHNRRFSVFCLSLTAGLLGVFTGLALYAGDPLWIPCAIVMVIFAIITAVA